MNILRLLADLADTDSAQLEQSAPRREALDQLRRFGAKALAAALPLGLGALPAQARDTRTILDSLHLALALERAQFALYERVLSPSMPSTFFPASDPTLRSSIELMRSQQQQHATLLTNAITASGGEPAAVPNYDFTGTRNGTQAALFPNVFTNFDEFLRLAQILEDAGVRAYKAQVEFLVSDDYILQTAVQMHSIEARHATRIRLIRQQRGATVKPWPSPADASITVAGRTDVAYAGEDALSQLLPDYTPVPFRLLPIGYAGTNILTQGVPEAFDEPLAGANAALLLNLFTY